MDVCEWLCYKEPDCVSVNFEIEEQQCYLNNATHRNRGAELKDIDGFFYRGADVRAKLKLMKNIIFPCLLFFFSFCTCPSLSPPPLSTFCRLISPFFLSCLADVEHI